MDFAHLVPDEPIDQIPFSDLNNPVIWQEVLANVDVTSDNGATMTEENDQTVPEHSDYKSSNIASNMNSTSKEQSEINAYGNHYDNQNTQFVEVQESALALSDSQPCWFHGYLASPTNYDSTTSSPSSSMSQSPPSTFFELQAPNLWYEHPSSNSSCEELVIKEEEEEAVLMVTDTAVISADAQNAEYYYYPSGVDELNTKSGINQNVGFNGCFKLTTPLISYDPLELNAFKDKTYDQPKSMQAPFQWEDNNSYDDNTYPIESKPNIEEYSMCHVQRHADMNDNLPAQKYKESTATSLDNSTMYKTQTLNGNVCKGPQSSSSARYKSNKSLDVPALKKTVTAATSGYLSNNGSIRRNSRMRSSTNIIKWIYELLCNQSPCIEWIDQRSLRFRIVDQHKLAQLWGQHKKNASMDFNKFA